MGSNCQEQGVQPIPVPAMPQGKIFYNVQASRSHPQCQIRILQQLQAHSQTPPGGQNLKIVIFMYIRMCLSGVCSCNHLSSICWWVHKLYKTGSPIKWDQVYLVKLQTLFHSFNLLITTTNLTFEYGDFMDCFNIQKFPGLLRLCYSIFIIFFF